jgi:alcohol dehydrogenase class IV
MTPFEFATAQRILFGRGRAKELPSLAAALGGRAALVTGAARRHADRVPAVCELPVAGEPTFDGVRAMADAARAARADVVVAIGGGSALDAGKALAMLLTNGGDPLDYAEVIGAGKPVDVPPAPFIAVPTTAGTGSEATRNAVLHSAAHRVKVSLRSPLMLPRVALIDPDLSLDLPPGPTAAGGMDALSQLIEPFLSCRSNPLVDALCRDGIPRIARALPRAVEHGRDAEAREDLALAALYSGIALANAGLGAVHGLAAAIGGEFAAPHGAVCAALLPGVFETNFLQSMELSKKVFTEHGKFAEVARLLTGRADATPREGAAWLRDLLARLGIPGLAAYGIRAEHAPALAEKAQRASSMKGNPVPLSNEALARVVIEAL